MVSSSLHCEFSGFLVLEVGFSKMGLKIDPILLNWIHPVRVFNYVLEFPHPVNNCVGGVGRLDLGVRVSRQLPVL